MRIPQHLSPQILILTALVLKGLPGGVVSGATVAPLTLFQFEEAEMGTRFTIQVYAASLEEVQPAISAGWERLHALNRLFSDYDPESELMRLCRGPAGSRVQVSPELYEILSASQTVARQTHGSFDITIGPLKRLWKQSCRDARLPSPEKIEKAATHTGFQKVQLHADGSVSLAVPGMRLDLGGIAKGYAAGELVRLITSSGFPRVLVAASGDIAVGEAPPGQSGWRIGIVTADCPFEIPPHSAISTSGDTEQFFELEGKRYSHILDPKTGLGLTHRTIVSVHGPDPVMTDALATAISVMGNAESLSEDIRGKYRFWIFRPERAEEEARDQFPGKSKLQEDG